MSPSRTSWPLALALCALAPLAAQAQSRRPVTAGLLQPTSSALLLDDATALTLNPATLGFSGAPQLLFTHENALGGWGLQSNGFYLSASLGALALGGAVEWIQPGRDCTFAEPCSRRSSLGAALSSGQLSLGAAFHSLASAERPELEGATSWDVGAAWRPIECAAVGFAALDVDAPRVGPVNLPRRFVGSLAVKPICDRVTIALDAEWASCNGTPAFQQSGTPRSCGLDSPDLRLTLDAGIFDGLKLLGQVARSAQDEKWSGQVGLALDVGHLGVRAVRAVSEGRGPRFAMQARLSAERFPALPRLPGRAVLVDLTRALKPNPPALWDLAWGRVKVDPLRRTLEALVRLGDDSSIAAVVLKSSELPIGLGHAEELRSGIEGLRAKGKRVVFYLENAGNLDYYVASSADKIFAAPQAVLAVNGFSATSFFLAAGLDKLGVKAEFFRVGAYKNAPDLFTRSEMSGEQREATQALLDDVTGRFDRAVLERRKVEPAKWKALLDQGLLVPQKAVEGGLLDGLLYPDQLEEELGRMLGRGGKVPLARVKTEPPALRDDRWGERDRIGIVRVEGNIVLEGDGGFGGQGGASSRIARRIRKLADDPGVKAIVVRIDSPGGDGNASDLIWRELVRARKEKQKPVVASMGNLAASGGYYVAAGADAIWAEPSTITGSIGVFAGHFDASGLLGKLGVTATTVKKAESADLMSPFRPLTDPERARMQGWVDAFYEQFLQRVGEARKLTRDQVHAVAQGRVWTGARAQEKGLVDRLGGLSDAIVEAKRRAAMAADEAVDLDDDLERGEAGELQLPSVEAALSAALGLGDGAALAARATANTPVAPAVQAAARALEALGAPGTLRARLPLDLELR